VEVVVPATRPKAAKALKRGSEATRQVTPPRARVLVVDDDERNLLAIRTVIEDLADVETAASGDEALRHLLKGEFAVILLDVYMPGMDGYETAQIIREREQTKRIPIVFLSAVNKEREHLIRGYSMGAVDYVFKPVEPIVLRSKVAVFVDLYTMAQEIQRKAAQEQRLLDENLRANAERLRIEQELRLAEQQQAMIIKSLPIILYIEGDPAGPRLPLFVGGNFETVCGVSFDDVRNSPGMWEAKLHPDDRARVLQALKDRRASGVMAIEYRWQCGDGEYRHFLDQAVAIGEEAGEARYAGTLLDVTEQRDLENQLLHAQKMDAIGKLTGGIAHDFNNLLAAVLGGIGLIERRLPLDEDQQRIIAMTRRAAEQGSELVGRLLAFARRQQLMPAEVNLRSLAGSINDLMAHTLGGLVELEWECDADVGSAFADGTQLELALMNLIINARDAMPKGGRIRVHARNAAAGSEQALGLAAGDYVTLLVEDRGEGIPDDMLAKVTEPFFTTKDVGEGTGLGLSMVYGFARQSGGTIDIRSTVGEGTTVEIWLPRAPGDGEREERPAPVLEVSSEIGRSLRILLVDDHDAVRETTAGMLRDMGHQVQTAGDGPSLLELLEQAPADCDLIVSDYAMPAMSGQDVLERARALRRDLPGIIISGYADSDSIRHQPGETVILTKPFTLDQMRVAITTVVSGAPDMTEAAAE
jgi:signal transduction histidine kinase/response regulator RpfG family c-di-GMP phosphodiesterase